MIFSHFITKFLPKKALQALFLTLGLITLPYSIAHTQDQITTSGQTNPLDILANQDNFQWQQLLNKAKERLSKTIRCLKDLLVVIQNLNLGKETKNQVPKQVIDTIKSLIQETELILALSLSDQLENNDTQEIIIGKTINFALGILNANKGITRAMTNALAKQDQLASIQQEFVRTHKELEKEQAKFQRSPILDIDAYIKELETENDTLHNKLNEHVNNFGLNFLNRQYRKLWNSRFGKKWEKHELSSWIMPTIGLAAAVGIGYYGCRASGLIERLKNVPQGTDPKTVENDPGLIGMGAKALLATGCIAIVNAIVQDMFGYLKDPVKHKFYEVKDWLSKTKHSLHRKLQGGIHAQYATEENEGPKVSLEDIIGLNPSAQQVLQMLTTYLQDPEKYCLMNMQIQTGILLIGPPRTGKTLFVAALSSIIKTISPDTKLFVISADTIDQFGISRIFNAARSAAPCIIFIDEIHLIAAQSGVMNSRLSALLSEMDGINSKSKDPKKQVIVIGATNQPEVLDQALMKPGRFGTIIPFELPSYELRKETIKRKMNKLMIQCEHQQTVIDIIAQNTAGANFEDLNQLVTNAFMKARINNEVFTHKHLYQALYSSFYRIEIDNPNITVPAEELKLLSIHFAGKALVAAMADSLLKLGLVTTLPYLKKIESKAMVKVDVGNKEDSDTVNKEERRFIWGNIFTYTPGDSIGCKSQKELINQAKLYLAGIVAEELILGSASFSCHPEDIEKAVAIAVKIACDGVNSQNMPKAEYATRYASALVLIEGWKKEIRAFLEANRDKLDKLIVALETKKILNQEEVLAIIK